MRFDARIGGDGKKGEPREAGSPFVSLSGLSLPQVDRRGLALLPALKLEAELLPLV